METREGTGVVVVLTAAFQGAIAGAILFFASVYLSVIGSPLYLLAFVASGFAAAKFIPGRPTTRQTIWVGSSAGVVLSAVVIAVIWIVQSNGSLPRPETILDEMRTDGRLDAFSDAGFQKLRRTLIVLSGFVGRLAILLVGAGLGSLGALLGRRRDVRSR